MGGTSQFCSARFAGQAARWGSGRSEGRGAGRAAPTLPGSPCRWTETLPGRSRATQVRTRTGRIARPAARSESAGFGNCLVGPESESLVSNELVDL